MLNKMCFDNWQTEKKKQKKKNDNDEFYLLRIGLAYSLECKSKLKKNSILRKI